MGSLFYQTNFICHCLDHLLCGRQRSHSHCFGMLWDWVHVFQFSVLHLIFKVGNGSGFIWLSDICHIWQICFSLYIRVFLVKLKTQNRECSFSDHHHCDDYSVPIIMPSAPQVKMNCTGSDLVTGGHNCLLVIHSPQTLSKQDIELFVLCWEKA